MSVAFSEEADERGVKENPGETESLGVGLTVRSPEPGAHGRRRPGRARVRQLPRESEMGQDLSYDRTFHWS
jgi:hypothetical protein